MENSFFIQSTSAVAWIGPVDWLGWADRKVNKKTVSGECRLIRLRRNFLKVVHGRNFCLTSQNLDYSFHSTKSIVRELRQRTVIIRIGENRVQLDKRIENRRQNRKEFENKDELYSSTTSTPAPAQPSVCTTKRCRELAASMKKAMNLSADPCDNFYHFACGNWSSYNPIPDDQSGWDNFHVVTEKVLYQLRDVLEKEDPNDLSLSRQKARTFYKACMDLDRMDSLGHWPLLELLQSTLGNWPVIARRWDPSQFNWLETVKKTKKLGFGFFLEWASSADPENPTKNQIHFVETSLGMGSRKFYFSPQSEYVRVAYKGLMRDLLVLLHDPSGFVSPDKLKTIQADVDEIYHFEEILANISRTEEDRRNLTLSLNKMTLEEFHLRCLSPGMTFDQLQDYLMEIMPNSTLKALIRPDMIVNVVNPDYFRRLHTMMLDYSTQPVKQRLMANYIGWRMTMEFAAKLTKKLRDVVENFTQSIDGSKKEPERWKICAGKVNGIMNTAVGSLYVKNYFDESSKPKVSGMVRDLRATFEKMLQKADWMDSVTRSKALQKLHSMNEYIAYPDYILNDIPRLDREYERLEFGRDHVYNCMNINRFSVETNLKDILKVNNRSLDEVLTPADVNAFYDPSNNVIAFVAGILQFPFYDPDRPEYLNYAGIGAVIGHEITHGFDDQGSMFDSTGKFKDWWSIESRARYIAKSNTLLHKYGSYKLPQGSVNGYLTLGENIADCGGVKEAYRAYQLYVQRRGEVEPRLPGFEGFTTEQLFFLGVAQDWCGSEREKTTTVSLLTASHSPRMFRVVGPLSGMPEFAETYRCALGSPMNPHVKAAVW